MKTLKINPSMDKAGIEAAIKSITNRGESLDKDIQYTGLSSWPTLLNTKKLACSSSCTMRCPRVAVPTHSWPGHWRSVKWPSTSTRPARKIVRSCSWPTRSRTSKVPLTNHGSTSRNPRMSAMSSTSAPRLRLPSQAVQLDQGRQGIPTDHLAVGILSVKPVGEAGPTEPVEA